jgi:WD40 repeat protein
MGNCQSDYSRHHVRIENPGVRKLAPSLRRTRKIVISYDDPDGIYFDEFFEQTMPLSPDATTLTTTSSFSTPLDPYESPCPLSLLRPSSDDSDTALPSPSSIRVLDVSPRQSAQKSRKGRESSSSSTWSRYDQTRKNFSSALRARLERSTFKQASVISPSNKETYQESEIPFFSWDFCGTNLNSRFSEEEEVPEQKECSQYSEDEANIWTEIETDANVTAVSMFRHIADHSRINLAVVLENGRVVVHEVQADCDACHSPKLDLVFTLNHGSRIRSIDFSSDGRFCAVGDDNCRCTIYRLVYEEDALCGASVVTTVERVDRVCVVQFNPHQPLLAIGGFDGKVTLFSTDSLDLGNELDAVFEYSLDGLVFALDWSPDGQFLAFGGSDKKCTILDSTDGWKVKTEIFRFAPVHSIKWSPSNNGDLAIGSSDTTIYDFESISVRHRIALNTETISMRHLNRKCTMCWSPNGSCKCLEFGLCSFSYCTVMFTFMVFALKSSSYVILWVIVRCLRPKLLPKCKIFIDMDRSTLYAGQRVMVIFILDMNCSLLVETTRI